MGSHTRTIRQTDEADSPSPWRSVAVPWIRLTSHDVDMTRVLHRVFAFAFASPASCGPQADSAGEALR
jgi:hypothetical protein